MRPAGTRALQPDRAGAENADEQHLPFGDRRRSPVAANLFDGGTIVSAQRAEEGSADTVNQADQRLLVFVLVSGLCGPLSRKSAPRAVPNSAGEYVSAAQRPEQRERFTTSAPMTSPSFPDVSGSRNDKDVSQMDSRSSAA
jgi:hypothetical protein